MMKLFHYLSKSSAALNCEGGIVLAVLSCSIVSRLVITGVSFSCSRRTINLETAVKICFFLREKANKYVLKQKL